MHHRLQPRLRTVLSACAALWACGGSVSPTGTQQADKSAEPPRWPGATPLCIEIEGLIVDSDAAELARSVVAVQLQEAARRGAGEHVGQAGGRLSTGIERSTRSDGSPVVTLTMGIEGYADRSVIFDGRLWARVNPVTWVGDYGGMVMVAGSLTGDVRLCGALGRALVRAALDEEERSEDPTPDLGLPVGADGRARKPLARP